MINVSVVTKHVFYGANYFKRTLWLHEPQIANSINSFSICYIELTLINNIFEPYARSVMIIKRCSRQIWQKQVTGSCICNILGETPSNCIFIVKSMNTGLDARKTSITSHTGDLCPGTTLY